MAEINELVARVRGAYSTVFERSLAKEAADALESLERDKAALAARIAELERERDQAIRDLGGTQKLNDRLLGRTINRAVKAETTLRECMAHADAVYKKARRVANGHDQIAAVEALDKALTLFAEWRAKQ